MDNVDKNQMIYRYKEGLNGDLQNLVSNQIGLGSAFNLIIYMAVWLRLIVD